MGSIRPPLVVGSVTFSRWHDPSRQSYPIARACLYAIVYNRHLSQDESALPKTLVDALRLIREQQQLLAKQQRLITRMQHQIEQLLRQGFGPKSEKHHADQLLLFGEPAVEIPAAPAAAEPKTQGGHGRGKLPASLPRHPVVHDLNPEQKLCPECGVERKTGSRSCCPISGRRTDRALVKSSRSTRDQKTHKSRTIHRCVILHCHRDEFQPSTSSTMG